MGGRNRLHKCVDVSCEPKNSLLAGAASCSPFSLCLAAPAQEHSSHRRRRIYADLCGARVGKLKFGTRVHQTHTRARRTEKGVVAVGDGDCRCVEWHPALLTHPHGRFLSLSLSPCSFVSLARFLYGVVPSVSTGRNCTEPIAESPRRSTLERTPRRQSIN